MHVVLLAYLTRKCSSKAASDVESNWRRELTPAVRAGARVPGEWLAL